MIDDLTPFKNEVEQNQNTENVQNTHSVSNTDSVRETENTQSAENVPNDAGVAEECVEKRGRKTRNGKKKFKLGEVTKCSLVLAVIAIVAGLLLGIVNWATYVDADAEIMEKCRAFYSQQGVAVTDVVKDDEMASYDYDSKNYVLSCFVAKDGENVVGYCYYTVGGGAKDGSIETLVFIGADGVIKDISVYKQGETAGYFDRVEKANKQKYVGLNCTTIEKLELVSSSSATQEGQIDAVSQATYTSTGYHNSVATAVYAFRAYTDAKKAEGGAR
ncbi:MAG: FMN-binding protein [Christensenellales bacterium]